MPLARLNDIDLYYEVHGAGPAIVFAHGRGGNHLSWWQQIPDFARDFRCVTFDHRSFGHSRDASGLGQEAFAGDLIALLDHLEIPSAHLVAQSMGGRTCLDLALRHPGRVRGLVLADTIAGIVDSELAALVAAIGPAPGDLLRRVLSEDFKRREPVLTFLYQQIEALNHVGASPTRLVAKGPGRAEVTRCAIPTLILVGDDDPLVPVPAARLLATLFPRAALAIIEGAGHSAYFEKPGEFNRIVRDFLADQAEAV